VAAAASSLGIPMSALDAAELAGLVSVDSDRIRFRHPLIRAAVYKSAPFSQRQTAHEALADGLRNEADADRRAWHRAAATVGVDEEVARALESSALRAIARSGHAAAASALERAARLSPEPAARARRLVAAAESASLAGQRDRALALLEEVRDADADVSARVAASRVRGVIESQRGSPSHAARIFLDAASAIYPHDRGQALELVTFAQEAAGLAGSIDEIVELGGWADRFGTGETREEEITLGLLGGFTSILRGDRPDAADALSHAAALGHIVDEPKLIVWAATAAMFLGDEPQTLALLRRAVAEARARGAIGALPFPLSLLAGAERRLGNLAAAEADADESLRLAEETGQDGIAAGALGTLAALAAFRGEVGRTEELAERVRALALPRGLALPLVSAERALAELDLARGRAAEALERLAEYVEGPDGRVVNQPFVMYTTPLYVEAAAYAGRGEAALPHLEAYAEWAAEGKLAWAEPLVARCRALVSAGDDEVERWYMRALDLHRTTPHAYEAARTQLLYGEFLRRARRKIEARAQLRSAADTFAAVGARLWAERATAELRATGATTRKRVDSTRADLTPQEMQIVRLVAEGKTNPEAAAQLFVSPKTVQYHLRKVFAKLGITSRTELVRLAAEGQIPGTGDAAPVPQLAAN
jgi:DNA-binding CsgD family transcriptional regulator/tetratricopeptide (TPR) repeat protein